MTTETNTSVNIVAMSMRTNEVLNDMWLCVADKNQKSYVKSATRNSSLNALNHMRVKHTYPKFVCELGGIYFELQSSQGKHMKTFHKEDMGLQVKNVKTSVS